MNTAINPPVLLSEKTKRDLIPRFKKILELGHPPFLIISEITTRSDTHEFGGGPNINNSVMTVIAALMNVPRFKDLLEADVQADEDLSQGEVQLRRSVQAQNITLYIDSLCKSQSIDQPAKLVETCFEFVNVLQPCSRVYDVLAEVRLDTIKKYHQEDNRDFIAGILTTFEKAFHSKELLQHKTLCQAIALMELQNSCPSDYIACNYEQWQVFRENVGIAAIAYENAALVENNQNKNKRAAELLLALSNAGHEYATIQAANMFAFKLTGKNQDINMANNLIELVERQISISKFAVNNSLLCEYLNNRIGIKLKLLQIGMPHSECLKVTEELLDSLNKGIRIDPGLYCPLLIALIDPDAAKECLITDVDEINIARSVVSLNKDTELLCNEVSNSTLFKWILGKYKLVEGGK